MPCSSASKSQIDQGSLVHSSSLLPIRRLVIRSTAHWELEATDAAGQFPIDLRVSVQSVIHTTTLLLVQHNLQDFASILLGPQSLAHNLDRVDHVSEDSVVHGGQGSRARTLLGLAGAGTIGALGAGQNAAHGQDQDVAVGELLLEFAGQALLDLVEAREEGDGDEDDDGALAVRDFELASRDELKWSQRSLEIGDVGLKFIEGGCDAGFQLGRMLP